MRCAIVCGAPIGDYEFIRGCLREDDFAIFCDCALRHSLPLGLKPQLIIGDFDSYDRPDTDIETIVLPREKDDTDSVFAVREALRRGYDDILLLGALGARFDHSYSNISILLWLHSLGVHAVIVDDYSELEVFSGSVYVPDSFPFFSLLNLDSSPHGLTIKNAKFPLENAEVTVEYQYAVSNEPLSGGADISLREGRMLLIKNRRA